MLAANDGGQELQRVVFELFRRRGGRRRRTSVLLFCNRRLYFWGVISNQRRCWRWWWWWCNSLGNTRRRSHYEARKPLHRVWIKRVFSGAGLIVVSGRFVEFVWCWIHEGRRNLKFFRGVTLAMIAKMGAHAIFLQRHSFRRMKARSKIESRPLPTLPTVHVACVAGVDWLPCLHVFIPHVGMTGAIAAWAQCSTRTRTPFGFCDKQQPPFFNLPRVPRFTHYCTVYNIYCTVMSIIIILLYSILLWILYVTWHVTYKIHNMCNSNPTCNIVTSWIAVIWNETSSLIIDVYFLVVCRGTKIIMFLAKIIIFF